MTRFRYLFHGTSSVYRKNIREDGLLPSYGVLHLTTHPFVALWEAQGTVFGEEGFPGAYKPGVGGFPLVVMMKRSAAKRLLIDPAWYDKGQATGRRLVQVRGEFATDIPISPIHLSLLEYDLDKVCHRLMEEINSVTRLPSLAPLKDA